MRTKLFITGMGGVAGRALVKYALAQDYEVGGTINSTLPEELKSFIAKGVLKCFKVNLENPLEIKEIINDFQPDVIVHLAGKVLGRSDKRTLSSEIYTENITIFKNVLSAAKSLTNSPRFILSSGCLVYDKLKTPEFINETPTKNMPAIDSSKEPYRASKLDQEKLLFESVLDYIIIRPTQFTGPGKISGVIEWYIAQEISRIIAGESKKILVRNKFGEVDMLDARDVASAILTLIKNGKTKEVYHISSGSPTTVENLAKVFLEVTKLNPSRFPVESTGIEQTIYFRFSPVKLNKLGWKPQFSLEDALTSYWEYFKNQEEYK